MLYFCIDDAMDFEFGQAGVEHPVNVNDAVVNLFARSLEVRLVLAFADHRLC
jgi:hypothetical protein